jgi:hypothetical protein
MMLLECPLLVSPILDSLLAVHIRIYTIVELQATFLFLLVIFSFITSQQAFGKKLSSSVKLVSKFQFHLW